ncbi:glycosyltransferase family 87 protein [Bradyrhizobium brasilense]|uniref:glycosyltransferase family 87 protein n=1 Tax=Bradyrhizobium brasilense TaxID=1419277 RepID=UPI002877F798|nr:glycosyltransferase family 87 protein [Bradyrhizobium brasilense]
MNGFGMVRARAERSGYDRALAIACLIVLGFTLYCVLPKVVDGTGATGLDFSCFWSAGKMALDGHAATAYDWPRLRQAIIQIHPSLNDAPFPVYEVPIPFFYPPFFLFAATLLALLPFPTAFWIWSTAKLLCWALVVSAIRPRFAVLLLAFAVPAVLYDFIVGQSSLLAASLLGAILLTLDRRPIVSGFLIALLIFKPQYGVLLPLVLIATGRWTVFITASLVTPVLLLLTGLTFGWDTFEGFREAAVFATTQFHLTGTLAWYKLQSVYGVLRFAGFGYGSAMALHVAVAAAAATWTLIIWRRNVSFAVKAACLLVATLLVSPYFAIYDTALLALALIFLMNAPMAEHGALLSNRSELRIGFGVLVLAGFTYPVALVPVGPFMCATLIAMIWMRCRQPGVKSDLAYG